ncbi:hypothetical protein TD95_000128 [Thielaviopsis punctulata]|uniref:Spermatogenesis-associated protein 20-like TRX domain-containing protein n=1 Tax=Thielaviopsis punctulata TaxID=72032 RepID=A0A0F4Z7C4_9PEZI|nr:hypothetical protein TD95_000128 [Thielaviopsis punctulata]
MMHNTNGENLANRAAAGSSFYVQEQKDSPVHWQLLDDDAVAKAKAEDKLIFLHIGYSACHYSHLMSTETFAYPSIAHELNRNFVPVVIDRDERPDLDAIYMSYVEAVHSVGGWPLNVFLTPELQPVFGGTYWPAPANDRASSTDDQVADFLEILHMLQKLWTEQRSRLRQEAHDNVGQLLEYASEGTSSEPTNTTNGPSSLGQLLQASKQPQYTPPAAPLSAAKLPVANDLDIDLMETAYSKIAGTYDRVYAGFTNAPKYVTAPKLSLLLRMPHFRPEVSDMVGYEEVKQATVMAKSTLRMIERSALHDHLGRGFARCSVTADWSLPFFERVMAENALLLGLYTDAWLDDTINNGGNPDTEFLPVVLELANYLSSEPLLGPDGLLLSAESADSRLSANDPQDGPGSFFLWTSREINTVLGNSLIADVVCARWNITSRGNIAPANDPNDDFVNRNVLRTVKDISTLATQFNQTEDQIRALLAEARTKLADFRARERPPPHLTHNAVAGYNGLAISALARTGAALRYYKPEVGEKYVAAAIALAAKVRSLLWDANTCTLWRLLCRGQRSTTEGFAEDYAYVIEAALALYTATLDGEYIVWATALQDAQNAKFLDGCARGGYFTAASSARNLLLRLKAGMDSALPSANAVAANNLFALGRLAHTEAKRDEFTGLAKGVVEAFEAELLHFPWLFPGLLGCVVPYRLGITEVARGDAERVKKVRVSPREGPVVIV